MGSEIISVTTIVTIQVILIIYIFRIHSKVQFMPLLLSLLFIALVVLYNA